MFTFVPNQYISKYRNKKEQTMLTILAWMVFIPAVVWNMILFPVVFSDIISKGDLDWNKARNWRDLILSLAVLFIPGVYLFGWF